MMKFNWVIKVFGEKKIQSEDFICYEETFIDCANKLATLTNIREVYIKKLVYSKKKAFLGKKIKYEAFFHHFHLYPHLVSNFVIEKTTDTEEEILTAFDEL